MGSSRKEDLMTDDRKNELVQMCRLEIRRSVTLAKMALADYGYHFSESVLDVEIAAMLKRLTDKSVMSGDAPLLRELVIADLWPRLRIAYADLRGRIWRHVIETNPTTVADDAVFAMDTGWEPLVNEAADRVATYPATWAASIVGGKEKFGCLVLHINCDYDQRGCRPEVERLREEIRLRSLATCDICGKQGRLRLGSYAKTVCDTHTAVLGDLREDDGVHADPWHWRAEQPIEAHINDIVAKGRAVMAAATGENPWTDAVDPALLAGMDPPVNRDTPHVTDPQRTTALGRKIDDDTWKAAGRKQDLLVEFGFYVEAAVRAVMGVVEEERGDWLAAEIGHWDEYSVATLSEDDRTWLREYVLELVGGRF